MQSFTRTVLLILILMITIPVGVAAQVPGAGGSVCTITDYGAVADTAVNNAPSIQQAVDACAEQGGGTVVVPAGKFVSGPIFLKSHILLHLQPGAVLKASQDIDDYPAVEGRWEGIERKVYASLVHADSAEYIAVTGQGTLDGSGPVWWEAFDRTDSLKRARGIHAREAPYPSGAPLQYPRPRVINFYRSANILIRDITIINSPSWTVHPVYCRNVTIDNITIKQPYHSPNTDGINPDSSTEVRISNCHIDVGDDCIAIKSGYNEDGLRVGRPTENVTISNCTFKNGRGGVVIGSEMSGDVRNVLVTNSVFDGTLRGVRIKTARGRGGVVEHIRADNLVMQNIPDAAFSISSSYGWGDTEGLPEITATTPALRDVAFSDITVTGANRVADISGLPERRFESLQINNLDVRASKHGLHIRHVDGLDISGLQTGVLADVPMRLEDINRARIYRWNARHGHAAHPLLTVKAVYQLRMAETSVDYSVPALVHADSSSQRPDQARIDPPLFQSDLPVWSKAGTLPDITELPYEAFQALRSRIEGSFSIRSIQPTGQDTFRIEVEADEAGRKVIEVQ